MSGGVGVVSNLLIGRAIMLIRGALPTSSPSSQDLNEVSAGGKDSNKGTRNSPSGNEKKECEVKAGEEKKANSSSPSAEKGQKEGNEVLKNVKEETVLDEAADVDNNNGGGGSDDNNDSDQESDDEYSAGV